MAYEIENCDSKVVQFMIGCYSGYIKDFFSL